MADIRLAKPQANTAQTVPCAADSRFVLEFPSDAALFARDGDDLVLTFEDGSSIRLQDFYTTYSKEEMPSFEMEGAEISGEDFFAALGNPDLMPAAGPTAAAAQGNSSFNVYGDAALLGGIDRLDGLDISFNFGQQTQNDLYASIGRNDEEDRVDHGVTVTPNNPGTLEPGIPVYPVHPGDNTQLGVGNSILSVSETDLGEPSFPQDTDSMQITAPDGVGRIVIGDVTVFTNGRPVLDEDGEPVKIPTEEGYLTAVYEPATGTLNYTYTLIHSTQEHTGEGRDKIAHNLDVTVIDTDGDSATSTISIVIEDDVPTISVQQLGTPVDSGTSAEGNWTHDFGADVPTAQKITVEGKELILEEGGSVQVEGTYGTLTVKADGTYSYEANPNANGIDSFDFVITDADNDSHRATLTVTVEKSAVTPGEMKFTTYDANVGDKGCDSMTRPLEAGVVLTEQAVEAVNEKIEYGKFSLSEDGKSLIFTQTEAYTHAGTHAGEQNEDSHIFETVSFDVTDANGNATKLDVTVTIVDDKPVLSDVTAEAAQIEDDQSTINLTFDGLSIGADTEGATLTVQVGETTFTGTMEDGKWVFDANGAAQEGERFAMNDDGTFSYKRPNTDIADDTKNTYTFTVTVKDADGDTASDDVTVTTAAKSGFTPDLTPGVPENSVSTMVTDDSYLTSGTVSTGAVDTEDDPGSNKATGSFTLTLNGREYTITINGKEGEEPLTITLDGEGNPKDGKSLEDLKLEGEYGTLSDFSVSNGTISYTYTQTKAYHHDLDDNKHDAAESAADQFIVRVSDDLHDPIQGNINVTIEDDGPVVERIDSVSNNTLTVDESYADGSAGPGLEIMGSAHNDSATLDASQLFTYNAGADGKESKEYSLSIGDETPEQKVLVNGKEYDLKLVKDDDGSIRGVAGDDTGTVIFKLTIDEGTGQITLDMTGNGSLMHPVNDGEHFIDGAEAADHDESVSIEGVQVTLTVTDTDGDSGSASADLKLTFEDDGPSIKVSEIKNLSDTLKETLHDGDKIDFTDGRPGETIGNTYKPDEWDDQVTISAVIVQYDKTNKDDWGCPQLTVTQEEASLAYSSHEADSNKGLTVNGGAHNSEIGAAKGSNEGEAIVIDLEGLAYGIKIGFGAFYSGAVGAGTDDKIPEKAQITFYKDEQVVYSIQINGNDDGKYDFDITDYVANGFDKVIISAVDNEEHSDFTIQNIDFVTTEPSIALYEGTVTSTAGADGFAEGYENARFNHDNDDKISVLIDGKTQDATFNLQIGSGGSQMLTATTEKGTLLFTAILGTDGKWTFRQHESFQVVDGEGNLSEFQLKFITKDGDGDISTDSATIPLKVEPSISFAEGSDVLTTDESYIAESSVEDQPNGSMTTPVDGDGDANSASASGSFSVNLNGQPYTLVIKGQNDDDLTLYFNKEGNLLESQGGEQTQLESINDTVINSSFGKLTITKTTVENGTLTVEYTYTQEKAYHHEEGDNDIDAKAEQADHFTVIVTDEDNQTSEGNIYVNIEDDGPVLTVTDPIVSSGAEYSNNLQGSGSYQFVTFDEDGTASYTKDKSAGDQFTDYKLDNVWGDNVTISAGKVTYTWSGSTIPEVKLDSDPEGYELYYSRYLGSPKKTNADYGIMVQSPEEGLNAGTSAENYETEATLGAGTLPAFSEAIIVDLHSQLAYGVKIDFGAFYSNYKSQEGIEQALVTFYRGGKPVGSQLIQCEDNDGQEGVVTEANDFLADGFDKVVISALGNVDQNGDPAGYDWDTNTSRPQGSSFTIQGIEFVTAPDPLYVTAGTVSATSGADGFNEDYVENTVQFAMEEMFGSKKEDGNYTLKVKMDGEIGEVQEANVTLYQGDSGNYRLTATIGEEDSAEQLFSVTLEKQEDGTFSWKMEQYKEFQVQGEDGSPSNSFDLSFITKDGDGDTDIAPVQIPLNNTIYTDSDTNNQIDIALSGEAGLIVTGDQESAFTTEPQNYNICFLLDTSRSMLEEECSVARDELAVESINNYIQSILEHPVEGTTTIQIIPFFKDVDTYNYNSIIISTEDGETTLTINGNSQNTSSWTKLTKENLFGIYDSNKDWHSGTNYAEAFKAADTWFDSAQSDVDNRLYFLTDGCPNKGYVEPEHGNGFHAVKDALDAFKDLLDHHDGLKVHAIGIGGGEEGETLTKEQMAGLAMFDNTSDPNQELGENEFVPTGVIYGNTKGDIATLLDPEEQGTNLEQIKKLLESRESVFAKVKVNDDSDKIGFFRIETNENGEYGFYYNESADKEIFVKINNNQLNNEETNTNFEFADQTNYFYTAGTDLTQYVHGVSQIVSSSEELTAALGTIAANTVSDDVIDASRSDTLVNIIYGDVMNTDGIDDAQPGSGYKFFENKNWSDEQITSYVHDHAVALGSETLLAQNESGNYDTYYRDVYGDIYKLDGDGKPLTEEASKELDFISREGGNDTIFGTKTGDSIFGQEGDDILFGDGSSDTLSELMDKLEIEDENATASNIANAIETQAEDSEDLKDFISKINEAVAGEDNGGNDQLYGGSGDDLLFGMGGDDYLVGGEGEDILFGGAGNDIIVYDKDDFMVSGGSGIDFMVTTDKEMTLDYLLNNSGRENNPGPIVEGIEVLLKGADVLSLTNMDQLASKYNITVVDNKIHLGDGWIQDTSAGSENTYTFNGNEETPQLTMEFNPGGNDQLKVILNQAETGSI